MIPEHMEPKGLERHTKPIAGYMDDAVRKDDAQTGSNKLLEAILRASGQAPPPPPPLKIAKPRPSRVGRPTGAVKRRRRYAKIFKIQVAVAKRYGITAIDLSGPSKANSGPRHKAAFLARSLTDASLTDIARHFNRDHTSILHAVRKVQAAIDDGDRETIEEISALADALS